ncbi:MAG: hypothetical protein AAGN46_04315 [Acidobacteriota bacterium]
MNRQMVNFLVFALATLAIVTFLFAALDSQTEISGEIGFAFKATGAFAGYVLLLTVFNRFYPLKELIRGGIDLCEDLEGTYEVVSRAFDTEREGRGRYVIRRGAEGLNIGGSFNLDGRGRLVLEETFLAIRGGNGAFLYDMTDGDEEFEGLVRLSLERDPPRPVQRLEGSWSAYSTSDGRRRRGSLEMTRVES